MSGIPKVGDQTTVIRGETGLDLTTVLSVYYEIKKPDGTFLRVPCTIEGAATEGNVKYIVVDATFFTVAGVYLIDCLLYFVADKPLRACGYLLVDNQFSAKAPV
jgi:hypothetical protein